jgi:uncharacterized protein YcbK (DUF882 family)
MSLANKRIQVVKGSDLYISKHFKRKEFDCKCLTHCFTTIISIDLVERLEKLRGLVDAPLKITSGFRCAAYQSELRLRGYETASGVSQHELGNAVDIMSEPLTGKQLAEFAKQAGFKSIGVGHSFIHLDGRMDKERTWKYTKR